jgi:hypothetical protein
MCPSRWLGELVDTDGEDRDVVFLAADDEGAEEFLADFLGPVWESRPVSAAHSSSMPVSYSRCRVSTKPSV